MFKFKSSKKRDREEEARKKREAEMMERREAFNRVVTYKWNGR